MERRIAHLDMDAFYASVELLRYPQLKGLPVVIGGRRIRGEPAEDFPRLQGYVGRGVATTATYEARALGVHSGMGLMKAAALAPQAILLPPDFERYMEYSRRFKAAVAEVAPCIEDRGIDEIYIDLTSLPDETLKLARQIKQRVLDATGLSCSIGITPNKLLSKIASDLHKPNGLTLLTHDDLPDCIWPLPVRKINGIGPRAGAKLEALGIYTIGHLAAVPVDKLIEYFGKHYGHWLSDAAHGRDERAVVTEREPKSISRETTFERDLHPVRDREVLSRMLLKICQRLSLDLTQSGYAAKTISIKLRYDDFRQVTRDTTIILATTETETIRSTARACLKRVVLDRKIRLLGVKVSSLVRPSEQHEMASDDADQSLRLFD